MFTDLKCAMDYLQQYVRLSDVAELYAELIPCGADRYKCLSFFKEEKTPSCFLDDNLCKYHCFATGESGDMYDLVGYKEGLELTESVEWISNHFNIELTQFMRELTPEEQMYAKMYHAMKGMVENQHKELLGNEKMLQYLHSRGVTDDSIDLYQLGYVGFQGLPRNEYYDMFQLDRKDMYRDALLLPIQNERGQFLYWQSRPNLPMGGKYVFVRDSHPLFLEPRLFGFPQARKKMRQTGLPLVITEGVFDCIAVNQVGYPSVAVLGTHITPEFWSLLERFHIKKAILLLDGDTAGQSKTIKTCESYMETQRAFELYVANLNEGLDPEEFENKNGNLSDKIDEAVFAFEHMINMKNNGCESHTKTIEFLDSVVPVLQKLDGSKFAVGVRLVAEITGMDETQVADIFAQEKEAVKPLNSIESEEIILGKMLRDWEFALEMRKEFDVDDFTLIRHKQLWKLFNKTEYVDKDTITTLAVNIGYESIDEDYVQYLVERTGKTGFAIDDFKDKLTRRRALKACEELTSSLHDLENDSQIEVDRGTTAIFNAVHEKTTDYIGTSSKVVDSFMDNLLKRMMNKSALVGYSFGKGFEQLNAHTLGLTPSELCMISATSSEGKSMLCCNWIVEWAVNQNIPCLLFSLEMSQEENMMRMVSILSGVEASKIMVGNLNDEEFQKVEEASRILRKAPIDIATTGHNLDEMLSISRRYVTTGKAKIIVVDYIQLMTTNTGRRSDTRTIELGKISKGLRQFALETNIPIVMVSQLGKQAKDKLVQQMEDVYGAYELAQDSSLAIAIRNATEEETKQDGRANKLLTIMKNRRGAKDVIIKAFHDSPTFRIREI